MKSALAFAHLPHEFLRACVSMPLWLLWSVEIRIINSPVYILKWSSALCVINHDDDATRWHNQCQCRGSDRNIININCYRLLSSLGPWKRQRKEAKVLCQTRELFFYSVATCCEKGWCERKRETKRQVNLIFWNTTYEATNPLAEAEIPKRHRRRRHPAELRGNSDSSWEWV